MSATIVQLIQGSPEWHAHRAKYRKVYCLCYPTRSLLPELIRRYPGRDTQHGWGL